jgi:hypothetical protein
MKRLWIPLLVVAVMVGAYILSIAVLDARVRAEAAAYRAAGHPVTTADIAPRFGTGDTLTAQLLDSAAACFEKQEAMRLAWWDSAGYREDPAGVRKLLDDKAPAYVMLMRASTMGPADFKTDYRAGVGARITPVVHKFQGLRAFLHMNARRLADGGRPDSALAVLAASVRLANAFAEPMAIYDIVEVLGLDTTFARAARVAPEAGLPAIERFVAACSGIDPVPGLLNALEAEEVMTYDALAAGYMGWADPDGKERSFPVLAFLPLRRYAQASHFALFRRQLEAGAGPWHEGMAELARIDSAYLGPGLLKYAARYGTLRLSPFLARAQRAAARRDVAVLGLKALAIKKRTGRLPATIAEVAPDAPVDRFSGRPYIYRITPDGYMVYGVGDDGKDDSGSPTADITFEVALGPRGM